MLSKQKNKIYTESNSIEEESHRQKYTLSFLGFLRYINKDFEGMSFLIIQYTNPKFWKAKVTKVEFFILQRILLVGNELSLRIMMMQVWCSVFSFSVTTMYMYYASSQI